MPYTAECEYHLDFRSKDKDKPLGVTTIKYSSQFGNHIKIRKLEKDGYKFYKKDEIIKITCKSIRKLNPILYKNQIPKPILILKTTIN